MGGYQRPEGGWRFKSPRVKINDTPDSLQPDEYPYVQNVRGYKDNTLQTRPGYTLQFSTANVPITDIRAYSTLGTDNLPRYLARNSNNQIYLDNGTLVASLGGTSLGAFFIPYRPQASPQSWMYIGAQSDYQKLSAPTAANVVTAYGVGIAEQQSPPEMCPNAFNFYQFSALAVGWVQAGTAGVPGNGARMTDTAGTVLEDPASGSVKRCSVQVATAISYQVGMTVVFDTAGTPINCVVQDVIPPINAGNQLTIQSIHYFSGTSGRCVIVPTQSPSGPSIPQIQGNIPSAKSIYSDAALSSLRRGAIVRLNNGVDPAENLFVNSVTVGPDGTICFEVVTTATYAATNAVTGIPCIIVSGITAAGSAGDTIDAVYVESALTGPGTGTLSQALATNPFTQALSPSTNTPQEDDYVAFSVYISDLSKLVLGTITFGVDPAAGYDINAFYAQFDASNLVFSGPSQVQTIEEVIQREDIDFEGNIIIVEEVVTTTTPLPSGQWTTVMFPVRALQRLGNDLTKTLANCNGVRISIQTSDSVIVRIGSFWIGGGGAADVGNNGSPYFYVVRGRNKETGAKSNPSPISRYGVSPRRQSVNIKMNDDTGDAQVDIWDVFRYGGTVNSWRYIGSTKCTGGDDTFTDNYFDAAALAGSPIEYDNFEPWPTIDVPFTATAGTVAGITTAITVKGSTALVVYSAAIPFTSPIPATVLRWLPGTLVTIDGRTAYTLWNRPTAVTLASPPAANYYAYLFQFVENAGTLTPNVFSILEPNTANQHLPYLFGPDANGTVFGCGDPFRPGNFYWCKAFSPDSAPSQYNKELVPPSEPLLGGEIINGLAMIASPDRWWALYPDFGSTQRSYQPVQRPVGRGLAAPYAHCTDGKNIYFVSKDGIWVTDGGAGRSLTDDDLFTLFPHEGINTPQDYTYATYVLYAPDYRYSASFRLSYAQGFLYFNYRDSGNNARTLICDLTGDKPAWSPDVFNFDSILVHYALEQQESTLLTTTTKYPIVLLGDSSGDVHKQLPNANDHGQPINSVVCPFEYNGGDIRSNQLFNDAFIDVTPVSGMQVRAISAGAGVGATKVIAASASRLQTNAPVGLELKYMGLILVWTDDFSVQNAPTQIHAWQPMYQAVPVSVFAWKTQATSFGWMAYGHLRQWNICYKSTANVIITVTAYDGTSPAVITLPSTGGAVRKVMIPFTFNKGMLYFFEGTSAAEWTPYLSESELYCGAWGRETPYQLVHDIEAPEGLRS